MGGNAGLAVSVAGDLFSGWSVINQNSFYGFGIVDDTSSACTVQYPSLLQDLLPITSFTVKYTMHELCLPVLLPPGPFVPQPPPYVPPPPVVPPPPGAPNPFGTTTGSTGSTTGFDTGFVPNPPAFPGFSDVTILSNWASTGVMTLLGATAVGLCALFGIVIAVNTSKKKDEVPLDVLLQNNDESIVTHENPVHQANLGVQTNQFFE